MKTTKKKKSTKRRSHGANLIHEPKGMHDVLPADALYWERVREVTKDLADFYGFGHIETPVLEYAELFQRTVGESSDIVMKEMYTVKAGGKDVLALRPEYTAGICRAYLAHSLGRMGQPQKLYAIGPVFRHDNPQLGRFRQFTQVSFEVIGGQNDPIYDAQVILVSAGFLEELRIRNVSLKVNSVGCRVCQPPYRRQLQNYYRGHEKELCEDCLLRLKVNPLRLLDCKEPSCARVRERAPNILDKICAPCSTHLKTVLEYLDDVGISYTLDNYLVRGLDYYSRTVFEFCAEGEGKEIGSVAGGGRYDYLMEFLGGHPTPAVGVALGVERLIAVMKAQGAVVKEKARKSVFVIHAGELAKKKLLKLIEELRVAGIRVKEALAKESLKAQLKVADREKAALALIFGQKEIYESSAILRDLTSGLQETVPLSKIVEEIKRRIR